MEPVNLGEPDAGTERDRAMGLRTLNEDQCRTLLYRHRLGRLAFVVDEQAMIFPVNYVYDGTCVIIRTAPGTKLAEAPFRSVAFEIDDASRIGTWGWSVVVQGPCFDVTDAIDKDTQHLRSLSQTPWAPGTREHWLSVVARDVTGRAFGKEP